MSAEMVHKVTLSSNKIVHMRPMKMRYEELAAQAASGKSGDNANMLAYFMQAELIKLLVIDVDGKKPTAAEIEKLDGIFSYEEISQLRRVVQQLMGESKVAPQVEIVSSGAP